MTDTLAVAVIQYEARRGETGTGAGGSSAIEANAAEHIRLIEDADAHGARFVLFPELSLVGPRLDGLAGEGSWLVPDDARLKGIREICRRTGITAVVGAALREADGTRRLASVALHPDGTAEAACKSRLHGRERDLFAAGNGARVIEVDGWRLALAFSLDTPVPDDAAPTGKATGTDATGTGAPGTHALGTHALGAGAAAAGADAYCVSGRYTGNGEEGRLALHMGALAMERQVFTLLANLGGTTPAGPSCGLSGIWAPDGLPQGSAKGTGTEVIPGLLQRSVLQRLHGRPGGAAAPKDSI